jgi:hypothetical protein
MIRRMEMALALVLASVGASWAQDQPKEKYEIQAWHVETWKDKDGADVTYLVGQVKVTSSTMELRAERVMAWKRADSKFEGSFDELYAEGLVNLKSKTGLTEAERLFLDVAKDRALAVDFVFRGESSDPPTGFVIRAKEVFRIARDKYVADEVSVSSCTYATPHFDVTLSRAVVSVLANPIGRAVELIPQFSHVHVQTTSIIPRFAGIPFFYFPGFSYELGMEFLIRNINIGESSRFGWHVYTDWGLPLYYSEKTAEGAERRVKYADIGWEFDWRERRGYAGGLVPKWSLPWMHGYIDSYYMHDHGPDPDNSFDRQFLPLIRHERWRARIFDRFPLSDEWRLDLEGSAISDRNFLPEFFRKEFLTGKEQETTAYLRWMESNMAAVGQARYRVNEFQSQLEYLPRLEYSWWGEPLSFLLKQIHYSHNTQGANARFRPDDDIAAPDFRTWRFDTQHELFVPIDFEVFQLNPFTLGRYTAYERNLQGDFDERFTLTGGADFSITISGLYEFRSEMLGMRDLRHIVQIRSSYAQNFIVTRGPNHFFTMDRRDVLNEFEELSMELRQRFQTKITNSRGEAVVHEFFKLTAEIEYYPSFTRDTAAVNQNNFLYPFNWIPFVPTAASAIDPRRFSNLWYTASFTPAWIFSISASGEIDTLEGSDSFRTVSLGVSPFENVSASLGHTYYKHSTNSYWGQLAWTIGPHWVVAGMVSYDFRQKIFHYTQFDLVRNFHDITASVRFSYDSGEHDLTVVVLIQPKIFR